MAEFCAFLYSGRFMVMRVIAPRRCVRTTSVIGSVPPLGPAEGLAQEGLAQPAGYARQVQLEGEALLIAVAAPDVLRVDAVERLLGQPDHRRVLGRDLGGQRQR